MHSADELEKCVRVTPPSAWVLLTAFAALIAGLLTWAIFGTIATRVPTKAAVIDGQAMCFLSEDDIEKMHVGDEANVDGTILTVEGISTVPVSRSEANQIVHSDYLLSALMQEDWAYQITFAGNTVDLPEGVPLSTEITTERIAPISLLLRSPQ